MSGRGRSVSSSSMDLDSTNQQPKKRGRPTSRSPSTELLQPPTIEQITAGYHDNWVGNVKDTNILTPALVVRHCVSELRKMSETESRILTNDKSICLSDPTLQCKQLLSMLPHGLMWPKTRFRGFSSRGNGKTSIFEYKCRFEVCSKDQRVYQYFDSTIINSGWYSTKRQAVENIFDNRLKLEGKIKPSSMKLLEGVVKMLSEYSGRLDELGVYLDGLDWGEQEVDPEEDDEEGDSSGGESGEESESQDENDFDGGVHSEAENVDDDDEELSIPNVNREGKHVLDKLKRTLPNKFNDVHKILQSGISNPEEVISGYDFDISGLTPFRIEILRMQCLSGSMVFVEMADNDCTCKTACDEVANKLENFYGVDSTNTPKSSTINSWLKQFVNQDYKFNVSMKGMGKEKSSFFIKDFDDVRQEVVQFCKHHQAELSVDLVWKQINSNFLPGWSETSDSCMKEKYHLDKIISRTTAYNWMLFCNCSYDRIKKCYYVARHETNFVNQYGSDLN